MQAITLACAQFAKYLYTQYTYASLKTTRLQDSGLLNESLLATLLEQCLGN